MRLIGLIFLLIIGLLEANEPPKVVICGVCRNVGKTVENTKRNIEKLAKQLKDYRVIIYENNSTDGTAYLFQKWANENNNVLFISKNIDENSLNLSRTQKIAQARNHVLDIVKDPYYESFPYILFVDLDFTTPWPIDAILDSINIPGDWDVISANGIMNRTVNTYYDRYAYRDVNYPLGPELIGDYFWNRVYSTWFNIEDLYPNYNLIPVYCAFGGMAIFKRQSIMNASYVGLVTDDLHKYYSYIFSDISPFHPEYRYYLMLNGLTEYEFAKVPILFRGNTVREHENDPMRPTCCEHLTFFASMFVDGHTKFYVNPKMKIQY